MRRRDREVVDQNKIRDIIRTCDCCRLGFSLPKGAYIVPMNFGYKENEDHGIFYFHSAIEGRKIELIKALGYAGFELDTGHKIKEAKKACAFGFKFQSIIGEGSIHLVEDNEEKIEAMHLIMKHYSNEANWDFSIEMLNNVSILKLIVLEMNCKECL